MLDKVKTDFGAIQSVLQQKFYPGITAADMKSIQGMNGGLSAIVSIPDVGSKDGKQSNRFFRDSYLPGQAQHHLLSTPAKRSSEEFLEDSTLF